MYPVYWSPSSAIDYASVASFSAALIVLAACLWELRVVPAFAVTIGGSAAALGLFAAGAANLLEDAFGLEAFGVAYVGGVLIGTFALIPMGVGLARGNGPRWIALAPLLSFPGLIFLTQWWGTAILVTTWITFGVLRSLGRLRLAVRGDASASG
jgi:hypothetical protein